MKTRYNDTMRYIKTCTCCGRKLTAWDVKPLGFGDYGIAKKLFHFNCNYCNSTMAVFDEDLTKKILEASSSQFKKIA